ncbi:carboxylesterase/lipase family protein [Streptomyces sp. 5.8]|uniref:carboxylesterase/lipase family protein n=1 Tax=Streptomyces sp. 5.8 TaxID=3406571 RepID=UPI003BB66914
MLKRTAHAVIAGALALSTAAAALAVPAYAASAAGGTAFAADRTGGPRGGTVVRTDKGVVRGTLTGSARTFRGIPYAAPPTGARRWAAPAPAERWEGVRDATGPGAACPQTGFLSPVGPASDEEDCLFVNVTTPRAPSVRPRPVMLYLHGGDHTDGAGAMYGAERLAALGDVVVVTVNYRLGALGYLAHPDLEAGRGESGNYGFLDQQAALRWVQRNARAFGGDPDRVTLFGQSAGGYSTCAHLAAPSSAGLFDRVILQSSPCTGPDGSRDRTEALADGTDAAEAIDAGAEVADWRTAAPEHLVNPFGEGPEYTPVYGGGLLPRTPGEAFASGRFNKVPVLQGINRDEERARVYGLELAKKRDTHDPDARLDETDRLEVLEDTFGKERAAVVAAQYPASAYGGSPGLALAAALTDGNWARHSVETGRALSRHVPTYTYEFAERTTPWYSDPQFPKPGFETGAGHTFELPYLFEADAYEKLTPRQQGLSAEMIAVWADFARTGTAGWKATTPSAPNAQSLASGPGGIHPVDFAGDHRYAFWKSLEPRQPATGINTLLQNGVDQQPAE